MLKLNLAFSISKNTSLNIPLNYIVSILSIDIASVYSIPRVDFISSTRRLIN